MNVKLVIFRHVLLVAVPVLVDVLYTSEAEPILSVEAKFCGKTTTTIYRTHIPVTDLPPIFVFALESTA